VATVRKPAGLEVKGAKLWRDVNTLTTLHGAELVLLEEACRIADRLDRLDRLIADPDAGWLKFKVNEDGSEITVTIDGMLAEARQQANVLKQMIAALRLPEGSAGARPQNRGGARGAYTPGGKTSTRKLASVTALQRAASRTG